jgi:predicted amidohydrolase
MESFRIAAVSMNSPFGQTDWMWEQVAEYTKQAAEAGCSLVAFPELLIHGHCTPNTWELAEPVPDGPATARLVDIARTNRIVISMGLSEKQADIVFNAQVLVGPDGYIGKQRKIHMSRDETLFYKGGREFPVHDLGFCKVGTIICYDNQFPEGARILALKGAELLLMPHAARVKMWEDNAESMAAARKHTHEYFTSCYAQRARENACFGVIANQSGRAGYVDSYPKDSPAQPHHCGAALVFSPDGTKLASTQEEVIKDEMILCDLDAKSMAEERSLPNYTLRTRRPELYDELTRIQEDC